MGKGAHVTVSVVSSRRPPLLRRLESVLLDPTRNAVHLPTGVDEDVGVSSWVGLKYLAANDSSIGSQFRAILTVESSFQEDRSVTSTRRDRRPSVFFLGGYHPVNESFIRSPPQNVELHSRVPVQAFDNFERVGDFEHGWRFRKKLVDSVCSAVGFPRLVPVIGRYDLVHTNGSIIPISMSPWIASIENPSAFYGFSESWHESHVARKRLARFLLSKRCRAVLPYSEASKRYLEFALPEWKDEINAKTQILRPAIDEYLITASNSSIEERFTKNRVLKFLFIGNHFFDKGGREVFRAFANVRNAGKCELAMVSSAPPHQEKEFDAVLPRLKSEPGVSYHRTGLPRAKLLDLYKSAHVFVFPSYMDQVPVVLLEAMAAGLPIIGSNSFAIPEMAIEGRNGLNIRSEVLAFPEIGLRTEKHLAEYRTAVMDESNFDRVVEQLIDAMTRFVKKPELAVEMGKKSLDAVREGGFSVKRRNEKLAEIYERSIRDEMFVRK
jgi:glycosyltransferase involved in cell wall biosynthesis